MAALINRRRRAFVAALQKRVSSAGKSPVTAKGEVAPVGVRISWGGNPLFVGDLLRVSPLHQPTVKVLCSIRSLL
jgi:hypothetical protein